MTRSINALVSAELLSTMESLLVAASTANAADPYVAADYDLPANALHALLAATFGPTHADRVRECTYDGHTVASAVAYVQDEVRANLADDYHNAVMAQAESDALRAFDNVVDGWCVEANLRIFAAATDALEGMGAVLALDLCDGAATTPRWADRDDADRAAAFAANLVTA